MKDFSVMKISEKTDYLISVAMDLVLKVFLEFEAPEYSEEGIQEFKSFITANNIKQGIRENRFHLWICLDQDKVIGVIASRPPCHISLLFVDKAYHRQGVAKYLYSIVIDHYKEFSQHNEMTVNSSPYAVEAYHRLGFLNTNSEQTVNGIRFIPMKHKFR